MATEDEITILREKLGESIPVDGEASDTLFTDEQIARWVDTSSSMTIAALTGWEAKLAELSNLVNVTDGAASRTLQDAFEHAQYMVKYYGDLAVGPTAGRSRVGKIVRV